MSEVTKSLKQLLGSMQLMKSQADWTAIHRAVLSPRRTAIHSRENTNEDSTTAMPQGTGGRSRMPMSRTDL